MTIELGPDQVSRLSESPASEQDPEAGPWNETAGAAHETVTSDETLAAERSSVDRTEADPFSSANHDGLSEATASTANAAPAAASPASNGGFGGALAAGVAGGMIALLLAGGLQWAGIIPSIGNAGGNEAGLTLRADVDALATKVAALDASTIDAETVKQALAPADKRIGELASELEQVKTDVAAVGSAAAPGASVDAGALKGVQDRLAKLEQGVAAMGNSTPSAQTVDSLGQKVASLDQTAVANSDALRKLQEGVAALGGKVAEQASNPGATAAIAASALKSAIDRGGGFVAELDMFAAVVPDAPELGELRALSANGVPTHAQLSEAVGPVVDRMSDATRQAAAGEGGVVDRLLASAQSLVRVRPVGEIKGDGVPARIARFRQAVTDGNLARASDAYDALPETAKAAGTDFMTGLQARMKVDTLAQKVLASALKTK